MIARKEKTETQIRENDSSHSRISVRSSTCGPEVICASMQSSNQAFNNYLNVDNHDLESRVDSASRSKHSEGTS